MATLFMAYCIYKFTINKVSHVLYLPKNNYLFKVKNGNNRA